MSQRSVAHARRSVLAVPASSDRFLNKAPMLDADMVMLDLEDAVAPAEKPVARQKAAQAIRELDWGDKVVGVRLNAWNTTHTVRDVLEVVSQGGERLDVVILAKTANAAEVVALDLVLTQLEREMALPVGHVGIEALIESAEGFANVRAICGASPRLEAVALGPGDLAASLGMPMGVVGDVVADYPGDHFHYVCIELLVAGRTSGLQVIDGPFLGLGDLDRLSEMAHRTRALGFDGKWAIHPEQLAVINEAYSPTADEVARAREMIRALDEAAADDAKGAVRHGGEMFDEVNRKMAQSILARVARTNGGNCT